LDVVDEEDNQKPGDVKRSFSDIAKIKMFDKKGEKYWDDKEKDEKSSLSDTLKEENIPDFDASKKTNRSEDELEEQDKVNDLEELESGEHETVKHSYQLKVHRDPEWSVQLPVLENQQQNPESLLEPDSEAMEESKKELPIKLHVSDEDWVSPERHLEDESEEDFEVKKIINPMFRENIGSLLKKGKQTEPKKTL
jgi:hypothetical protein